MKKLREEIKGEIQKDGMVSKNAFRVSKKTKSLETEEDYEYTEDDDYYEDDAPIINIKFKRDTSSLLMKKLREEIKVKLEFEKERMLSKNALRVSKKTKAIETEEEYDFTGDMDSEDASIINIKFKRDTSSLFLQKQMHKSILVQSLRKLV